MKIVKRDCTTVDFDKSKIKKAILKSMKNGSGIIKEEIAKLISEDIEKELLNEKEIFSIYDIEKLVFKKLCEYNQIATAKSYEGFRVIREFQRNINTTDEKVLGLYGGMDKEILDENSNKNSKLISTTRDLVAEIISKDISKRMKLPTHISQAHDDGLIYIHDLGHYLNDSFNCCLVNLKDMLENGTVINGKSVTTQRRFSTACTVASQIIAQVASGQHGGQTISIAHLSPFVRKSREMIYSRKKEEWDSLKFEYTQNELESKTEIDLKKEIKDGIQTIQYQINTLQTSNGQSPFLSIFMYINEYPEYEKETVMLIEEMLKQRIKGMQNKVGAWISPAFPKLLYVTDENNIHEDSQYYWLTQLACKCVTKRMMPDFLSAKLLKQNYEGNVVPPMGCRAFLSPYKGNINNKEGKYKLYGRFNMGLTSINLADVGLSAKENMEDFWKILDQRLELCHESLILRYKKIENVNSDVSPIHWQYGALARLEEKTPIKPLLQNGYSTITLGYIGIYECVMALIRESHTTEKGKKLSLDIMKHMKEKINQWKKEDGLGYALYGTPSESLTEYFAKTLQKRFGVIKGITDKNYLTNSYHVNVKEEISPFEKLKFEGEFHSISSGGAISYIETANMSKNLKAIEKIVKFCYDNTQYAEFNTKLDYCMKCNFEGEILIDENLEWYCPNCGNKDRESINVVRRTCGYLGENFWNEGRTQEIKERYIHLDNHEHKEKF